MKKNRTRGVGREALHLKRQLRTLRAKFDVEKNAKNDVYYFILSNGLLDHYRAYTYERRQREANGEGKDPFLKCFDLLAEQAIMILRQRGEFTPTGENSKPNKS